jgi:hypothetical protein
MQWPLHKTKDPATGTPLKISGTREEWAVPTPHVAPMIWVCAIDSSKLQLIEK